MNIKQNNYSNSNNNINKNTERLVIGSAIILITLIINPNLVINEVKAQSGASSVKTNNKIIMHFHPRLNITIDGKSITVPAQIGINSSLWKDHSLDKYGMQAMNMVMPGMAPLHTMDNSGNITVESSVNRNYTLGEFLNVWGGLDLNGKTVKATVDGKPVPDYRNIVLRDREQINLQVGK